MSDFLATDPPGDLTPRASTTPVTFESGGQTLLGVLHLPAGPGPHPAVVLLHGFPGNERNFDLAHALRRAGYASLVFHYRGSWGVGGSWSWGNVFEDAARVVRAVREEGFAATHRLDPARLAVAGHSLGGYTALRTAAADPAVRAVAAFAAFDLGAGGAASRSRPEARAAYEGAFAGELLPLRGTSAAALVDEMEAIGAAGRLGALAPRLSDRPVLLIGASGDTVAPPAEHHAPTVAAFGALPRLEHHLFPTDHSLADHRVALARTVAAFLDRWLGP
jgi:pimeloyl-ACP methyl ester carboxylesterase